MNSNKQNKPIIRNCHKTLRGQADMFRDLAEGKLSDIISNCWAQLKNPEARPSAEVIRWAVLSSWGEWEGRKAQWIVVTLGRTTHTN